MSHGLCFIAGLSLGLVVTWSQTAYVHAVEQRVCEATKGKSCSFVDGYYRSNPDR